MENVCRTCLRIIGNNYSATNLNEAPREFETVTVRQKLTACVPELTVDIVVEPTICSTCTAGLTLAYQFKSICLETEKTLFACIRQRQHSLNCTDLLNVCDLLGLVKKDIIEEHNYSYVEKYTEHLNDSDSENEFSIRLPSIVQTSLKAHVVQANNPPELNNAISESTKSVVKSAKKPTRLKRVQGRSRKRRSAKYFRKETALTKKDKNKRNVEKGAKNEVPKSQSGRTKNKLNKQSTKTIRNAQTITTLMKTRSSDAAATSRFLDTLNNIDSDEIPDKGEVPTFASKKLTKRIQTRKQTKLKVAGYPGLVKKTRLSATATTNRFSDRKNSIGSDESHDKDEVPTFASKKLPKTIQTRKQTKLKLVNYPELVKSPDLINKKSKVNGIDNSLISINVPNISEMELPKNKISSKANLVQNVSEDSQSDSGDDVKCKNEVIKIDVDGSPIISKEVITKSESHLKSFLCPTCKISFTQKQHLQDHLRLHISESSYQCKICSKTLSCRTSYERHLQTHTSEKSYSCHICGKVFIQKIRLVVHLRTHTSTKPYSCSICYVAFSKKGQLLKHGRMHTGKRLYTCDLCPKRFTQRVHLNNHKKHHNKNPH